MVGYWPAKQSLFLGPPAVNCHDGPDSLDDSKRPRPLQKSIRRSEGTRSGKRQNVPPAAMLKGIANQHRCDREQAKESEIIHSVVSLVARRTSGNPAT